ncbi:MAG: glycosyltransferase family 4 protein [Pikeienuella sp.]
MSRDRAKRLAFYAPMKAPDHPNPSGDRRIARLLIEALGSAGWDVGLASRLRAHQREGDPAAQDMLFRQAERIVGKTLAGYERAGEAPAIWFTYHCYYKAPDLIGPAIARALSIPYVVAEGYRSRKRLEGPYARFAQASERALDAARVIFHLQPRGLDALERDRPAGQALIGLKPFLDPGPEPARRGRTGPLRLLSVAMMRPGDKLASFRALAAALCALTCDWRLDIVGDGRAREQVEALAAPFAGRVVFHGRIDDPARMRDIHEKSDLFLWPGVNEAFGMVYLEAQAAGLAVIAEDRAGVREVVAPSGRLTPPGDAAAFAAAIDAFAADRAALAMAGAAARAHVRAHHGIEAAAAKLDETLRALT